MRLFRTRKPRRPALALALAPPVANAITPSHRISTLSNATTLYSVLNNEPLSPNLLSSFPLPPSASSFSPALPIQSNIPLPLPHQQRHQQQPQDLQSQDQISAYPYTFLPNTSQSSLETLADPLGRLPNAPNRLSTYEAFINNAREQEVRRIERQQRMVTAWIRAEEERRMVALQQSRSWPHDPWRGGFGPPTSANTVEVGLGIGIGGGMGMGRRVKSLRRVETPRPKMSGNGVQGVKVWLRKVTSLERLRA